MGVGGGEQVEGDVGGEDVLLERSLEESREAVLEDAKSCTVIPLALIQFFQQGGEGGHCKRQSGKGEAYFDLD